MEFKTVDEIVKIEDPQESYMLVTQGDEMKKITAKAFIKETDGGSTTGGGYPIDINLDGTNFMSDDSFFEQIMNPDFVITEPMFMSIDGFFLLLPDDIAEEIIDSGASSISLHITFNIADGIDEPDFFENDMFGAMSVMTDGVTLNISVGMISNTLHTGDENNPYGFMSFGMIIMGEDEDVQIFNKNGLIAMMNMH